MNQQDAKVIAVRDEKTVYLDGETNSAVKVFERSYEKAGILNEALNHAIIEETALPVPALKSVETIGGKWAIVTEYIPGKTLAQLMAEDADNLELYLDMLIEVQMDIHDTRAPRLSRLKDKMYQKVQQADIDAATRYEIHHRLASMPIHNKVCHGDLNPTNIIIDDAGRPFVLDWAHVTQGNASADVARTYLLFRLAGDEETACKYMDMFCEKTSTDKRYIQQWLPIVAVSQSVKGKPQEREFLLSWTSVFEYE
ncbi:MAG: aminoglycoside phosphotransferase family protein [Oscillospiraceae bacterium]|jgi:aminoglycoside phosphotransferase (APT) family kinase protein|nr:aminoglycoside phosphotransferase family protein [Oscillospiraceae bacterium]